MEKLGWCKERGVIVVLSNGASYTASNKDLRRLSSEDNYIKLVKDRERLSK